MYKVIIVDDDRIIRKGLSTVIPWDEHGFELAGEAPDGETGLELIAEKNPDIIISDIQMPFMDGLEMAKAVKEKNVRTKIILLTGYEDFKYAHEAIKIRAFDYLLKPVDTSVLIEKLNQAAAELDMEAQRENQINDSQSYLQQQFLKKLSLYSLSSAEMDIELSSLGVQPVGSMTSVLYIKIDQPDNCMPWDTYKEKIIRIGTDLLKEIEINGQILNAENENLVVFLFGESNKFEQKMDHFCSQLLTLMEERVRTTITITMGRVYRGLSLLRNSFLEAVSAMDHRHIVGINRAYSIEDVESLQTRDAIEKFEFEEDLMKFISLGIPEKVTVLLDEAKTACINKRTSLQEMVLLGLRVISLILHESSKFAKTWNESRFIGFEKKIIKMQTAEEIFAEIKNIAVDLAFFMSRVNGNQKHSLVDKAIVFIKNNYHVANLNLQMVAEEVHVSPAYLSNLFKVEKGFNFGDFLFETRMKNAMELFRKSDLKTYEVAERTGYSNPQYFSSSFKKYTGYSPAEFRKLK